MRKAYIDLLEAVNAVQMKATGETGARAIAFGIPQSQVPEKLLAVLRAAEAAERVGASALTGGASEPASPTDDPAKLREVIDGLFQWMKIQGLDVREPTAIVAETLKGKGKRGKRYVMLPKFAPNAERRKKQWKPVLTVDGTMSADEMKAKARDMGEVADRLGPAAAR